jgi:hypothetical protein
VTATPSVRPDSDGGVAEMLATYRRLATMDPPALRSLAVELDRLSEESSASAALHAAPAIEEKARRDAQPAAAARAALASVGSDA